MYIMFQCSIYMYDISIYRSIDQSIDLSIYLPIYLSTYLSIYLSIYLFIYLSIYRLSIYLSMIIFFNISLYLNDEIIHRKRFRSSVSTPPWVPCSWAANGSGASTSSPSWRCGPQRMWSATASLGPIYPGRPCVMALRGKMVDFLGKMVDFGNIWMYHRLIQLKLRVK